MKIDTLGVQAFVAIAECGSFTQAADTLHVTQTAITQRLRKLEAFLGVALVERTTRRTELTEIGRRFLPQARRLLNELSDALTEIRETGLSQRGDITIACVPTVGVQYLPRILRAFSAHRPHDRVKILDHASASVLQAVLRREAEFGINIGIHHHSDLQGVPLVEDRIVMICRKDHPLAPDRARYPGELIAMVIAGTRIHARDAAEAVRVEYEVLPAVTDVRKAQGAEPLWPQSCPDNVSLDEEFGDAEKVKAAFAAADVVEPR